MQPPVDILYKRSARRFIARWNGDRVRLTAPADASDAEVREALDKLLPRLMARRPQEPLYADGQVIEQPGIRVEIRVTPDARGGVGLRGNTARAEMLVDPSLDLADAEVQRTVSGMLMRVARMRAQAVIVPMAAGIAAGLGVKPRAWLTGSGLRTLGTCSGRGEITLSGALMYMPDELRRYVICHELAHLTHHNHSEAFHALADRYLDGRERELDARLKAFRLPLVR